MTKAEFIMQVASKSGLSQKDTNQVVKAALETITEVLQGKDSISFVGFGSFSTVQRAPRISKIPSTGESIEVPEKTAVKFKVGKELKEKVAN